MPKEPAQKLYIGAVYESVEPISLETLLEYIDKGMTVPMREVSREELERMYPKAKPDA